MAKYEVLVLNSKYHKLKQILIDSKHSLLHGLLKHKLNLDHSCDGNATCGTCSIQLLEGQVCEETELEKKWRLERGHSTDVRLSCQIYAKTNLIIKIN